MYFFNSQKFNIISISSVFNAVNIGKLIVCSFVLRFYYIRRKKRKKITFRARSIDPFEIITILIPIIRVHAIFNVFALIKLEADDAGARDTSSQFRAIPYSRAFHKKLFHVFAFLYLENANSLRIRCQKCFEDQIIIS